MTRIAALVLSAAAVYLASQAAPALAPFFAVEREFVILALAIGTTLPLMAVLSVLSLAAQR